MKLVPLNTLFEIKYGVNLELVRLEQCDKTHPDSIPFISRTENNNGISAYVIKTEDKPNPKNSISVAGGGSVMASFYQDTEYYSGRDIYYLLPKKNMSLEESLFYCFCLRSNRYKYNYGRQANKTLKNILVPERIPEDLNYIHAINLNNLNSKALLKSSINLLEKKLKCFCLNDLFIIKGSKTTPLLELEEYGNGKYPYVTTQATNNGVSGFYNFCTDEGNILTVDSAVIGYCSYQPLNFSASDHVEKLIPRFHMNKFVALFFATVINQEQYRYNYGRKSSQSRMKKSHIYLPVNSNSEIDLQFMEDYVKCLPYSSSL